MAHELIGKRVRHEIDTDYFGTVTGEYTEGALQGWMQVEWEVPPNGVGTFGGIHKPETLIVIEEG